MKKLLILLFPFIIINLFSKDYNDKDEIFKDLKEKFSDLKSISLSFKSEGDLHNFSGKLEAKKNGKYKIILTDRLMISNGKNLWNYSINEKKVLLSSIEKNSETMSLNSLFFNYLNSTKPQSLKKVRASNKSTEYQLELFPIDDKSAKSFKSIKVWLDQKLIISKIEMTSESSTQSWLIKQIKMNPKSDDKLYDFKIPKDVELIDLR